MPVGTSATAVSGTASMTLLSACSTTVVDCVVATQDSTMCPRSMPTVAAAASCETTSWRNGSSAQVVDGGNSEIVDLPLMHTGRARLARK